MDSTDSLLTVIANHLSADPLAAELKWFWFRAALSSYKRNFLLRPFPPAFRKNLARLDSASSLSAFDDDESKDFEKLASVSASIPPLSSLWKSDDESLQKLSLEQIRLLAWVLDTDKYFRLGATDSQMYEQIKKLTGQQHTAKVPEPDYIFQVDYDEESETKFQKRRGDRKTIFAYHGSRLANFYSIVRNGLRSSLNQVSAFGEGTYLSPELSVSLNWSPMSSINVSSAKSSSDPSSLEGTRLSCIAVCEVIDDPTGGGVSRCECAFDTNSSNLDNSNTNGGRRSGGGVPDRYILVKNDDLLRIRYILAYVERSNVKKVAVERGRTMCDRVSEFCNQHRFWLIMLAYILLLAAVGLANSNSFQFYVRRILSSATSEYGYFDNEYPGENFHHGYEDT